MVWLGSAQFKLELRKPDWARFGKAQDELNRIGSVKPVKAKWFVQTHRCLSIINVTIQVSHTFTHCCARSINLLELIINTQIITLDWSYSEWKRFLCIILSKQKHVLHHVHLMDFIYWSWIQVIPTKTCYTTYHAFVMLFSHPSNKLFINLYLEWHSKAHYFKRYFLVLITTI